MQPPSKKEFAQRVYRIVAAIPPGRVATYGQLALLAGCPRWARQAGKAMSVAPRDLTSHRVVYAAGRLVPGWAEQRGYLEAEGVTFRPNGHVDMAKHRWRPE